MSLVDVEAFAQFELPAKSKVIVQNEDYSIIYFSRRTIFHTPVVMYNSVPISNKKDVA